MGVSRKATAMRAVRRRGIGASQSVVPARKVCIALLFGISYVGITQSSKCFASAMQWDDLVVPCETPYTSPT